MADFILDVQEKNIYQNLNDPYRNTISGDLS
jgi:hypothetical protein